MSKYKAILFDLWDTLAEITNLNFLISDTKKTLGDNRYKKLMGQFFDWHKNNKLENEFINDLNTKISLDKNEIKKIKDFIAPKHYEKFPETTEVLKKLMDQDLKIILVTNSPPTSKIAFQEMGISQFFYKTVFSCDLGILKPNEKIFKEALRDLNIKKVEALMVGDSFKKDVQGAIKSGLDGLLLDRKGLSEYTNKISNLREVLDVVKKI